MKLKEKRKGKERKERKGKEKRKEKRTKEKRQDKTRQEKTRIEKKRKEKKKGKREKKEGIIDFPSLPQSPSFFPLIVLFSFVHRQLDPTSKSLKRSNGEQGRVKYQLK